MARTPDEFPGERIEDSILLVPTGSMPEQSGEFLYLSGSGFRFYEEGEPKRLHEKVLVSPTDTTAGYLHDKIPGSTLINSGSNELLLISGSSVPATQIGQVLFSADGLTFSAFLPVTTPDVGWIIQDDGIHIVVG